MGTTINVEGTSWYQQKVTKQNKRPVGQGSVERRTRNNRDGKTIKEGGFASKQEYINCQRTKLINF